MKLTKKQFKVLAKVANHTSRDLLHSAWDLNQPQTLVSLFRKGLVYRKPLAGRNYYMATRTGIDVYEAHVAKLLIADYKKRNRLEAA